MFYIESFQTINYQLIQGGMSYQADYYLLGNTPTLASLLVTQSMAMSHCKVEQYVLYALCCVTHLHLHQEITDMYAV